MSCKHCTNACEADGRGTCYECRAFRGYEAKLFRRDGEIDGIRWLLGIEDTDEGLFCTGMAAIPVEYCPWCGRRLGEKGDGE